MDITKMTVTELKALAYDTFAQIEQAQKNLQAINQEIAKKLQVNPETTTSTEDEVEEEK